MSNRVTEILTETPADLIDSAAFLDIKQRPDENDWNFRTRVAYAMAVRILKEEGKAIPDKIARRLEWLEANELQPGDLMPV